MPSPEICPFDLLPCSWFCTGLRLSNASLAGTAAWKLRLVNAKIEAWPSSASCILADLSQHLEMHGTNEAQSIRLLLVNGLWHEIFRQPPIPHSETCSWIDTGVAHAGCDAMKAFNEVRISPFARREAEKGRLGKELELHQLDNRHMAILQRNDFWRAGQLLAFLRNGNTWVCPQTSGQKQVFGDDVSLSDAPRHIVMSQPNCAGKQRDSQAALAIPQPTRCLVSACHFFL